MCFLDEQDTHTCAMVAAPDRFGSDLSEAAHQCARSTDPTRSLCTAGDEHCALQSGLEW
jgi:hypothetical protein